MTTTAQPIEGRRRLRPAEGLVLAVALVWGALLVVAATQVPVYESETATFTQTETGTSTTTVSHGSATLVDENGSGALLIIAVPLAMTVLVAGALWMRGSRRGAGLVAWTLTGLLGCFNLLAMLTIGIFIVPVTACLVLACALRLGRPPAHAR